MSRKQLNIASLMTTHAHVKKYLYKIDLYNGDSTADSVRENLKYDCKALEPSRRYVYKI